MAPHTPPRRPPAGNRTRSRAEIRRGARRPAGLAVVLWLGLALLAALCTTSCQQDETVIPATRGENGFALGLRLPPPGSWDEHIQVSLQDSLHVWLYRLGTDPAARFTLRPHPDNPQPAPFARAGGEGTQDLVLEIDPVAAATWWRIFVRRGQLLGQTTFVLAPRDRELLTHVVLGPTAAAANRLVVYTGLPVGPGSSPPAGGASLDPGATLLFPVAVENAAPLTALAMEFALDLAEACAVYADPGSRLFDAGDSLAYAFAVAPLAGFGEDCRRFSLQMQPSPSTATPIPAGTDILFYIAAFGDDSPTALCVDPRSVRFTTSAGIDTLAANRVVSPADCVYPACTAVLLSPPAGSVLCTGSEATITWEAGACCPPTLGIVLLRDGVVCREIVASTPNDGEYIWTVTGCAQAVAGYTIALLDQDQRVVGASAGPFGIAPECRLRITAPNGGEQYRVSENVPIGWEVSGCCGSAVDIELLRDGAPCLTIAAGTPNDGELLWTVATCAGQYGEYTIRVTDLDTGASDESDRPFIIGPACTLDVTYPDGGELLCAGESAALTWNAGNLCGATVRLELLQHGAACLTIAAAAPNSGSYPWTVAPCTAGADGYRLRVSDEQSGVADTSSAEFSIAGGCALAITSPGGSANVCEGDPVEITWTSSTCCGPAVRLALLRAGSLCQVIADSIPNTGTYVWNAARCAGDGHEYTLQVIDLTTGELAVSDGTLRIDACTLAVTAPDGSEPLCYGDEVEIVWTSSVCCGSEVALDLVCDGVTCASIASSTPNDGVHLWTVAPPPGIGGNYTVRVTDLASGESAASVPFVIGAQCSIAVTGPLPEDFICEGLPVDITWTYSACCQPLVRVELLHLGQVCATLEEQTDNDGVLQWVAMRCSRFTDGYTIRVAEVGGQVSAVSPAAFTINPPCAIEVLAPAGQETLCQGQSYEIKWEASACCVETVIIDLLRNGLPCDQIVMTANDGSYVWSVAACGGPTDAYAIRITDPAGGYSGDSGPFSIQTCTLAVTAPAGGGTLCAGDDTLITWTYSACCGETVAIELLRGGNVCLTIASAAPNNGRHAWVAEQCGGLSDDYRVRVRDLAGTAAGVSASAFTIEPGCLLTVTAPVAGAELCPGELFEITWNASSCCPETFTIELLCEGQVCELISSDAAGGLEPWAVPAWLAGTGNLRIRIRPDGAEAAAESGPFSVLIDCALAFTYPNGGEELCAEEPITITWNHSGCCGTAVEIALLNQGEVVAYPATTTVNDGALPWTPRRYGGISIGYQLRIRDLSTGVIDYTDALFRINPECSVTVLTPNLDEWYYIGMPVPITWSSGACCGSTVRITLLHNEVACLTIASSTPNDGSYLDWQATQCGTWAEGYKIQVTDLTTGAFDRSDYPFIISP